jgi:hypothetical protein
MKKIALILLVIFFSGVTICRAERPTAIEIKETLFDLYMEESYDEIETYINQLYVENEKYIPALLAKAFFADTIAGESEVAKSHLVEIKTYLESANNGGMYEDLIVALGVDIESIQDDLDNGLTVDMVEDGRDIRIAMKLGIMPIFFYIEHAPEIDIE